MISSQPAHASASNGGQVSSDLLVLGGGILGLATACEVLSRGLSVTLFDGSPERSATLAAAGMLSPYAEQMETPFLQELMRAGRASFPSFVAHVEEVSGCKVELAFPGTLLPSVDPGDADHLLGLARHFVEIGASARYLSPAELRDAEPLLQASEAGAVLLEDEGYVNTRSLAVALRTAFDRLGGTWIPLDGLGLVVRQQRVAGVETANGVVLGRVVLNSTGAHAERFLLPEDQERYRARPVRGQALRLRPSSAQAGVRRVIHAPGIGYLVPQADGSVILGATSEPIGPFTGVTARGIRSVLRGCARLVPSIDDWAFIEAWSGLRPLAGDGEPILAPDARKGLYHGLGLYRHGILLAPVASTRLAKMILDDLARAGQS